MFSSCGDPAEKAQKELLEAGVIKSVLDVKGPVGNLALLQAISQKNYDIVRKLLTAGADVNASLTEARHTPLLLSIRMEDDELINIFLEAGANADFGNTCGETPLSLAVFKGKTALAERLLKAGAAVDGTKKRYWSPLMAACAKSGDLFKLTHDDPDKVPTFALLPVSQDPKKQRELVDMLIKAGADVNRCADEWPYWSPLAIAAAEGRPKMVKQLLAAGAATEPRQEGAITALTAAVLGGQTAVAELLLKNGARVNAKSACGVSPLFAALTGENTEMVSLLCRNGGTLPELSDLEHSLLAHAFMKKPEMLKELNKHNITAASGKALVLAIRKHDTEAVGNLLECGANVKERDEDGNDALRTAVDTYRLNMAEYGEHHAADAAEQERMLSVLRLLLQHHADADTKDNKGESALVALISSHLLAPEAKAAAAEILLEAGAALPKTNKKGEPILCDAFNILHKEESGAMVTLMIRYGADPNAAAKDGLTPLHDAISHGCRGIVTALVEGGADVNRKTGTYQNSPLYLAIKMSHDVEIARILIEHGADVHESLGEYINLYDMSDGEMKALLKAHGAHSKQNY